MKWNNIHNGIFKIASQLLEMRCIVIIQLLISAHVAVTDRSILPSTHVVLISKPYKAKLLHKVTKDLGDRANGIVTTLLEQAYLLFITLQA